MRSERFTPRAARTLTDDEGRFAVHTSAEELVLFVRADGYEYGFLNEVYPDGREIEMCLDREASLAVAVVTAGFGAPLDDAVVRGVRNPDSSSSGTVVREHAQ